MYWINILHFYLSPTVDKEIVKQVVKESYFYLLNIFKNNPRAHITVNLTGCLTENLVEFGYQDLLKQFKKIAKRGQVEFTGCASFHSILPLMPKKEVIKQIKDNEAINKKFLGNIYKPEGFYLPEMAYSPEIGKIIKELGYKWLILDQVAYPSLTQEENDLLPPLPVELTGKKLFSPAIKFQIKSSKLFAIFRQRKTSKTYIPKTIYELLKDRPDFLVTATDAEMYGHRHCDRFHFYQRILKNKNLKTLTVSEYLQKLKAVKTIEPRACNWESSLKELKNKQPFILWKNPKNIIQRRLWQLANLALKLNYSFEKTRSEDYYFSRLHLEKGISSCVFWWASEHDFKLLGPPAWSPEEIEKGALELTRSVRALKKVPSLTKLKVEKLFLEIEKLIWQKHWKLEKYD